MEDDGLCLADLDAHQPKHTILNSWIGKDGHVLEDNYANNNMVEGWGVSSCECFWGGLLKLGQAFPWVL